MRGILAIMRRRYNAAAAILHSMHPVPRERPARAPHCEERWCGHASIEQQSWRCSIIGQRRHAALAMHKRTTKKAGRSRLFWSLDRDL